MAVGASSAAGADTVTALPQSDYTIHEACTHPRPGHASCLALRLVAQTSAARAHTHPLGMSRVIPVGALRPLSAATGGDGLRPQDLRGAYFAGEAPEAPASEPQTIALVDAYNDPTIEADLASYLLFDGPFCRRLIEMGRADAQARRDELLAFFRDDSEEGGGRGDDEPEDTGRVEPDSLTIGT